MKNNEEVGKSFMVCGEHDDRYFESFPPGWRFCPTDDELILHYLATRTFSQNTPPHWIRTTDLYRYRPEDLVDGRKHTLPREDKWFYYTSRDRKYPNGFRPNRAAADGYWKPTGKDKIWKTHGITARKKSLDFYSGKNPNGEKTNWKMHEYRLDEELAPPNNKGEKKLDDVVLCKIYKVKSNSKERNDKKGRVETVTTNAEEEEVVPVADHHKTSESEPCNYLGNNNSINAYESLLDIVPGNHHGALTSILENMNLQLDHDHHEAFYAQSQQCQNHGANYTGASTSTADHNNLAGSQFTHLQLDHDHHEAFYAQSQQCQNHGANYTGASTSTADHNNLAGSQFTHYDQQSLQQQYSLANYPEACNLPQYASYESVQPQFLAEFSVFNDQTLGNHYMEIGESSDLQLNAARWEWNNNIGTQMETAPNHVTAVQHQMNGDLLDIVMARPNYTDVGDQNNYRLLEVEVEVEVLENGGSFGYQHQMNGDLFDIVRSGQRD